MKTIKIADAREIFREQGFETLSPCCHAIVYRPTSLCCNCGQVCTVPFYFISSQPIPDQILIDKERELRSNLPVGAGIAAWITPNLCT